MSQIYSSSLLTIYFMKIYCRKYSGQNMTYPCSALQLLLISSLASYAQLFVLSAQLLTLPAQLSPLSAPQPLVISSLLSYAQLFALSAQLSPLYAQLRA